MSDEGDEELVPGLTIRRAFQAMGDHVTQQSIEDFDVDAGWERLSRAIDEWEAQSRIPSGWGLWWRIHRDRARAYTKRGTEQG